MAVAESPSAGLPTTLGQSYPYIEVDADLTTNGAASCQQNQLNVEGSAVGTMVRGDFSEVAQPFAMCQQFDGTTLTSTSGVCSGEINGTVTLPGWAAESTITARSLGLVTSMPGPGQEPEPLYWIDAAAPTADPLVFTYDFANLAGVQSGYYVLAFWDVLGNGLGTPEDALQASTMQIVQNAPNVNEVDFAWPPGRITGTITAPSNTTKVSIALLAEDVPMGKDANPVYYVDASGSGTSWSYSIPFVASGTYYAFALVTTSSSNGPPDVIYPDPSGGAEVIIGSGSVVQNFP